MFRKNCTYCGGTIEDNYPPAAIALGITISSAKIAFLNKHFYLSIVRSSPVPYRHNILLYDEGEAVRQVQPKLLLRTQKQF